VKSILDKSFVYTPSHRTNIAETFRRLRDAAAQENKAGAASAGVGFKASDSPGAGLLAPDSSSRRLPNNPVAAAPIQIRRKA
jgi:hypothetical protein